MFDRKLENQLIKWKVKPGRKPLILRGGRQTGKTTLVRNFAKKFNNFVEINLEIDSMKKIFSEVKSIQAIVQSLEAAANRRIIPGETLLFIDEIQNSIPAIKLLRYFHEEIPNLHVIGAGSLLEVRMKREGWAFPVGRVEFLYLYPVTFLEFLKALREDILLENILACEIGRAMPAPIHEKIINLLVDYLIVGGMPEAVKNYQAGKHISAVRDIQADLSLSFKEDFAKYSKETEVDSLKLVWDKVPFEIGNRIKYAKFSGGDIPPKKISNAFDILHEAMLIERIFPSVNTSPPLLKKAKAAPKALFLDMGLCTYALNLTRDQVYEKLVNPAFAGALFEGFVGQELLALDEHARKNLFFWLREDKGASAEVDYLLQFQNQIFPIEVKAGRQGSLKSLHQYLHRSRQTIGIRAYNGGLKLEDHLVSLPDGSKLRYKLLSIPFYLVPRINELLQAL